MERGNHSPALYVTTVYVSSVWHRFLGLYFLAVVINDIRIDCCSLTIVFLVPLQMLPCALSENSKDKLHNHGFIIKYSEPYLIDYSRLQYE